MPNSWVNVECPDDNDFDFLTQELKVPESFLEDIADADERPRTETEGNWLLTILRIPVQNAQSSIPYTTVPIGIITNTKTISSNPNLVRKFVQATKKGYEYAYAHPGDAAGILVKEAPDANLKPAFVKKSMKTIVDGQYWGDPAKIKDGSFTFGTNDLKGTQEYFDFLAKADAYTDSHGKVIHQAPQSKDLATDEFLK